MTLHPLGRSAFLPPPLLRRALAETDREQKLDKAKAGHILQLFKRSLIVAGEGVDTESVKM